MVEREVKRIAIWMLEAALDVESRLSHESPDDAQAHLTRAAIYRIGVATCQRLERIAEALEGNQ